MYVWMMKSNHIKNHSVTSSHFDQFTSIQSCEEQASADDIGEGPLGGYIWPPRVYLCSFCKREFKSSQALGGHMNVHRRDKARLNQPLCLNTSGADKVSISDSSNPSDVLASFYSNNDQSVRIVDQGDLVTNKLSCMNHLLRKESTVETGLFVGLNFGVPRNRTAEHTCNDGDVKRRRTDGGSPMPFLYIACSSSDKDIDLELRLGKGSDRPH